VNGAALKGALRRAERLRQARAVALVLPLLAFLLLTFALPLAGMLWRAAADDEVPAVLPRTLAALARWDGRDLPGEAAYRALIADLAAAREAGTIGAAARRLNYDITGFRTLLANTARRLPPAEAVSAREALAAVDERWADRAYWAAIRHAAGPLTDFYLLAALDLRRDADGRLAHAPEDEAIYRQVFLRTLWINALVTAACLAMGFPVAYLLATLPPRLANPLLLLVLLPFWTSLLVRSAAWVVLLQNQGIVNGALIALGVIDAPVQMIFNRFGVVVAMTHVLLPFMILPLYSVMKTIPPSLMRAAASLGAPPLTAFLRVYLPQCLPGIGAGTLLVFILAIGFFITPALVGGAADQMIAYFIAFHTTGTANWGMASALGAALLAGTLALYAVYARLIGAERLRLG
jgi:putative spermidine/putrescine transport system permease protein